MDQCLTPPSQVIAGITKEVDNDPGEPLIPIKVGKLKILRALLDYGAVVSILPGSLYDQYDFGPLLPMDGRVVFADDTWKRPRGMVKDVMIQLGEFYYPVDFMVLDYASGRTFEQPKVILGRPFLYTANAYIDCREGIVSMTSGTRKLFFNIFTKSITYDIIVYECVVTNAFDEFMPPVSSKVVAETSDEGRMRMKQEIHTEGRRREFG